MYSVAVTLHELFIGRKEFFTGDYVSTIANVSHMKPRSILTVCTDVNPETDAVIQRALEKNASQRFSSAMDLADALLPLIGTSSAESGVSIASQVRADFTDEMAEYLGVEPLANREKVWRAPSTMPDSPIVVTAQMSGSYVANMVASASGKVDLEAQSHTTEIVPNGVLRETSSNRNPPRAEAVKNYFR